MKIMKVLDKKIGDTIYYKYRINLPKDLVEQGNFLNKELKIKKDEGKIIIEKNTEDEIKPILTEKEKRLQKELVSLINKMEKKNNSN